MTVNLSRLSNVDKDGSIIFVKISIEVNGQLNKILKYFN